MCVYVRAINGKWLELSTSNFVLVYSVTFVRHVLTQRSKGQRLRAHGYKNRYSHIVPLWGCTSFDCLCFLVMSAKWTEWKWRTLCFHFCHFCVCVSVCLCILSPIGLNVRTAEKCIRLVHEKLRIFPYRQYIVGNVVLLVFWWCSQVQDQSRGWGEIYKKCSSYIMQSQAGIYCSYDVIIFLRTRQSVCCLVRLV